MPDLVDASATDLARAIRAKEVSSAGLPIGVQIVARPWREDVVLAVVQVLEEALSAWQRPPL
jgi:Asp-tRNA(Asn)/Glu-tRNA(Gln) amidotransferase A subunit family amidase